MNPRFIVVNDDAINNFLCKLSLTKLIRKTDIRCFESSVEGLKFITSEYTDRSIQRQTILFLDIHMPVINGWDFLDEFAKMEEHVQKQFSIYIVSSAVDPAEKMKAMMNIFVRGYLEKPLKTNVLSRLLLEYA